MKISTGTLVLNAESILPDNMLNAQLEQLYYIADEIFITEGATKASPNSHYWDGDTTWLTSNGHSTDKTVEIIKSFPDPDKKITLIQKNGFWNGKTEMCNEWSLRATGDYIWQIDSDEFYKKKDIDKIKRILEKYQPDAVHFYANHFWGDFKHCFNEISGKGWGNNIPWMRIFKHKPGAKWISHEPPNYILPDGSICNNSRLIPRDETLKVGLKMYHYSYVSQKQKDFKVNFFKDYWLNDAWDAWKKNNNTIVKDGSYTVEFNDDHPEFIIKIIKNNE
jgi:hypothetical protein